MRHWILSLLLSAMTLGGCASFTPSGGRAIATDSFVWRRPAETTPPFEAAWAGAERELVVEVWRPARAQAQKMPVVIFSPGGRLPLRSYTTLYADLARHGYAVFAVAHLGMGDDWFPTYGRVRAGDEWRPPESASEHQRDAHNEVLSTMLAEDAAFVARQIEAIARGETGGALDGMIQSRPALIGHSRGGRTVARYCANANTCWAAVILDNFPPARDRARGFSMPTLLLRVDGLAPPRWTQFRIDELARLAAESGGRVVDYPVAAHGLDHMSFTDQGASGNRHAQQLAAIVRAFLDQHRPAAN